MKALGVGIGAFAMRDVEVLRSESGAPTLTTRGRVSAGAKAGIASLLVSLTPLRARRVGSRRRNVTARGVPR